MKNLPRLILLLAALFTLNACNSPAPIENDSATNPPEKDRDQETQEAPETPGNLDAQGPWNGALYATRSDDGVSFEGKDLILEHAGVPNLLERENGDLILTYQYFSEDDSSMFDVIAYSLSEDEGKTWSEPSAVSITNMPTAPDSKKKPMDPTLVETEDGQLRLYFTFHAKGNATAALYSATAADGKIDSDFVTEQEPALMIDENLLDPSVVYFDGLWHHYTWQDRSEDNYHSVSQDGLSFVRKDDINLPMDFLGQVIPFESGLMFYGTDPKGIVYAYSQDGYGWEMGSDSIAQGADPSVAELSDGSYLMIYTSINFN